MSQEENKIEGYCVKCKSKHEMKNIQQITFKNGRAAKQGNCSKCNTKMFKIGGEKKKKKEEKVATAVS